MLPKVSLLSELKTGGYEASLITTFNAYLPFYEEVVLRRLVSAGVRHNVLMMDAGQYAECLDTHPPRWAGRRYTLVPMAAPGAFHPKLILLTGKKKGLIAIGSHNMTLAGFGFNRELTNIVKISGADDEVGVSAAKIVWREVQSWLERFAPGVPDRILNHVRRVPELAPWFKLEPLAAPAVQILGGQPGSAALWDQLLALIGEPVDHVSVTGAFFDHALEFLRRIKRDLRPKEFIVGIDPRTVKIPSKARELHGVQFVRANGLGIEDPETESASKYLHAKAIYIRRSDGAAIFASGSANPSRPAWLAETATGNVELMLVRTGAGGSETAEALGFSDLGSMPPIDDDDWQRIAANDERHSDSPASKSAVGLAIAEDGQLQIHAAALQDLMPEAFVLVDPQDNEIARKSVIRENGDYVVLTFPAEILCSASQVYVYVSGKVRIRFLIHHARIVEDQARTGVQRRFKEALLSLETDTPNISLLIECIDKIIFADEKTVASGGKGVGAKGQDSEGQKARDLGSLAIDVEDVSKRHGRHRLRHSSDLGYLLDALIYHLRVQEDVSREEVDQYGRSEEEQVGADDEDDAEEKSIPAVEQTELLDLCHKKVRRVVRRMNQHLVAFAKGQESPEHLLVRLLGVLAVLRELRSCDGRVSWVDKGSTTVPRDVRKELLDAIVFNLFDGQVSLLRLDALGPEFEHSDDVGRLKGLILWLAWDVGLTLNLQKPFMESLEKQKERLRENAMVLALAQLVIGDEVVLDEARSSIGSLTSGELDWGNEIRLIASQCAALRTGVVKLRSAAKARPGDVAIHKNLPNWDLRVVESSGGGHLTLIRLSKDCPTVTFRPEFLQVGRLQTPREPTAD
jgi:hypothetical protein